MIGWQVHVLVVTDGGWEYSSHAGSNFVHIVRLRMYGTLLCDRTCDVTRQAGRNVKIVLMLKSINSSFNLKADRLGMILCLPRPWGRSKLSWLQVIG